ncbi:helix-turn-helix domain-containing protein [Halostagnicola sp. A-GB9-2]|uniref:winged helix-turn-helix domain-containing protein n=1 Tax=Halostagnicola sp. A-GB9-2 TaxID=3048066 RepID=UPI0024BFE506|nr:helix-turn-helix domain-containing protein [Halostagnicola sp. A-GB9-2]MDJ1433890.1 helix-turn-helix domain-containing protein [Halostagnicola sp. A-GB9-2]
MSRECGDELPGDVFRVLSHDLRLTVLDVLERTQSADEFAGDLLAYSDLADRVAERRSGNFSRDSGNLSYHFRTLRDVEFIERVDGGYRIKQAGIRIVRAIRAGTITDQREFEAITIDEP